MENGFTEHNSKGLFTFYREQNELQKPITNRLVFKSSPQRKPNHYASLACYQTRKNVKQVSPAAKDLKKSRQQSSRYSQIEQAINKSTLTPKNVLSLNFNPVSARKNEFYFQLISCQNRRNQERDSQIAKPSKSKLDFKRLIGQLSVREMPSSEVREFFKPKKDYSSNIHSVRKNPLKMNPVAARCLDDSTQFDQKNMAKVATDEGDKFHMPFIKPETQRNKNRSQFTSTIFKDVLQLRRNRLENNSFWEELKERRPKKKAIALNLQSKVEQWSHLSTLPAALLDYELKKKGSSSELK